MRSGREVAVTAKIPDQRQGQQQQSYRELAPRDAGGRLVGGLSGASRRIFGETPRGRIGRGSVGCGIRVRGKIFTATIFMAAAVYAAIFLAKLVAAIIAGKIVAGKIVGGKIFGRKIVVRKIAVRKMVAGKFVVVAILRAKAGRGDVARFTLRGAEIRKNGLPLNLTLAQCGQIIGHGFFFVESDLAGVGADETLVEYAAGKLVKVFVFEGAQHAGADFGGVGDGVERNAALLTLFAKFFSERSHGRLRRAGLSFRPMRIIIGEGGGGRHKGFEAVS